MKKIWATVYADSIFRKQIRVRDKICVRFNTSCYGELECSHFSTRTNSATRYDLLNSDLMCEKHHQEWELKKKTDYRKWKIKQLGKKAFNELEQRAHSIMPRKKAIEEYQRSLGKL